MRRHILTYLLVAALPLTSCLDETPRDQTPEAEAYTTPQDLYLGTVATLYNYMGGQRESEGLMGTCRGVYDYNTLTTDEALIPIRGGDWYDGGLWEDMYRHTWHAADTPLYDTWCFLYKVVTLANHSLDVISEHADLLTPTERAAYEAEVRAIRALFYYHIQDLWGRVPLTLSKAESADSDVRQAERSRMFRFIVGELQTVEPLLPQGNSAHPGPLYGRMTRSVAHFLLARLAINAEVYADDDWTDGRRPQGSDIMFSVDGREMNAWQTCVYYCDLLADEGYTLEPDCTLNFSAHNETSRENIFTIPADKETYAAQFHYIFRSIHYRHGGTMGWGTENGTSATIATMRAYRYGQPDEDRRLAHNFFAGPVVIGSDTLRLPDGTPLVYEPMEVMLNLTGSPHMKTAGARMKKYEVDPTAYNDGRIQDADIVLFRYADALLMKAEAMARNGEDAAEPLCQVRRRAQMPAVAATLDNILEERLLELVWEGTRRQDLVRYGLYTGAYDLRTPLPAEHTGYTTVFPIPQRCLDLNPNLTQNKGY